MSKRSKNSERAATLIIALPLIVALLLVGAFVLTLAFRARERTRLQVASDATAQAAAGVVCSSKTCWENSRKVALETLRLNAKLNSDVLFDAADTNPDGSVRTHWESAGYSIKVERGMWLPNSGFESLEADWQRINPGKPKVAVQNAIRVEVASTVLPLIDFGIKGLLHASGSATALAQEVESVCAAPFAIPACALYNQAGELDQKQICLTDRLFTAIDHYCPGGGDCGVLPDFDYEPLVNPPNDDWTLLFQQNSVESIQTDSGNTDISCFFPTPRSPEISDHFGVVGVAGTTPANVALVRRALMQPYGCTEMAIGQPFSILAEGLTTRELGELVWSNITNAAQGGGEDRAHGEFSGLSSAAGFNGISDNINRAFSDNSSRMTCEAIANHALGASLWSTRPSYGVCNSRRTDFGNWSEYNRRSPSTGNPFGSTACPSHDQQFNQPAWHIKIPVIAEPGETAASCAGTLNTSTDPRIEASKNYEIVGFVSVVIFDQDIGSLPPSLDNFSLGSEARGCAGIGEGVPGPDAPPPPPPSELFPFGFVGLNGTPTPCNIVRARIDCNSNIFASSFDNKRNLPRLVE